VGGFGLGCALVLAAAVRAAAAPAMVAVLDDGSVVRFDAESPGAARRQEVSGLGGRLIGVDVRPADGLLYGLTDASDVYRIALPDGAATLVSTLTVPFDGGVRSGIDFNPALDRLRLVSAGGRNLRVNVALGATAVDAALAYAAGDAHAGARPQITAAAYSNNRRDVATTRLFEIDAGLDVLVAQDPPNDGVLNTIGPLGVDFGPTGGFDIVTDADGTDHGWAASGATLYRIDLASGRATVAGTIGTGGRDVVSLAVVGAP
jgi:hypothetical protein